MLRITELKLPIELADTLIHQDDQIKAALLKRLEIPESDLISFSIFKRGVDARKSHAILYVYNLDVEVKNEAKILAKFKKDPHIKPRQILAIILLRWLGKHYPHPNLPP